MKKIQFNWKQFFDWRTPNYITIFIILDLLAIIPYLKFEQVITFPHAGPGGIELWFLVLSLLHKAKWISVFSYALLFVKLVIAICIIQKKRKIIYCLAIGIYIMEFLAAIWFILSFRIPETGVSTILFVESAVIVFTLSIILLLVRQLRQTKTNQGAVD